MIIQSYMKRVMIQIKYTALSLFRSETQLYGLVSRSY